MIVTLAAATVTGTALLKRPMLSSRRICILSPLTLITVPVLPFTYLGESPCSLTLVPLVMLATLLAEVSRFTVLERAFSSEYANVISSLVVRLFITSEMLVTVFVSICVPLFSRCFPYETSMTDLTGLVKS